LGGGGGSGGSGDLVGPASATDNAITRFDSTTGKLVQNSSVTISDTGAIIAPAVGSVIPFYFANQSAFPSAATYHGAVAHSHADGKMYFAHGGVWNALANVTDIPTDIGDLTDTDLLLSAGFGGSYNDLTDTPAIPADVSDLTDTGNLLGVGSADSLTSNDDINITINNDDSSTYVWNFGNTGDLTAPGDIKTGLLNTGGRFVQDCADGVTSMRWINVEEGDPTTQILRVYTGETGDERIERAQLLLNWSGESDEYSGFTIKSFDNTDPENETEHDWLFQGDGDLSLPGGGLLGQVWGDGIDTELTLKSPPGDGIDSGYVALGSANEQNYVEVSNTGVVLAVKFGQAGFKTWTFDIAGDLLLPGKLLLTQGGVQETFQAKADATGVVDHDCALGQIFYHTSPDANWTANFANLNLGTSASTNLVLVVEQGATPYYPSAVQIGGFAQTIKWLGNVTPTPAANKTEIATFTIFNNAGTFTVLGSYSTYG
jgi:hypothetical protein